MHTQQQTNKTIMKHLLLLLGLGLALTSCQKDHYLDELNAEKEKNVQLTSELSSAHQSLRHEGDVLATLQSNLSDIDNLLNDLTEDHTELTANYATLLKDYNDATAELAALTQELANENINVETLQAQIDDLNETIAGLQDQIEDLLVQISNFNTAALVTAAKSKLVAAGYHVFPGNSSGLVYRIFDHPRGNYYIRIAPNGSSFIYDLYNFAENGFTNRGTTDTVAEAITAQPITVVVAPTPTPTPVDTTPVDTTPVDTTPVDTTPVDTTPTPTEEVYVPGAIVSDLPSEVIAFEENGFWKVEIPAVSHSGSNVRYTLRKYSSSGSHPRTIKYGNSAWREGIASSRGGVGTNSNGVVWYYVYVYENGTSWVEGNWCAVIIPTRN